MNLKHKIPLPVLIIVGFALTMLLSYLVMYLFPEPVLFMGKIPQVLEGSDVNLPGMGTEVKEGIEESYALTQVLPWIIKVLLQLAVVLAIVFVILGGWFYIASFGDEAMMTKGRNTVLYALFGLVFALLSYAIVDVISSISW